MEIPLIRLTPENVLTIGLLSGVAYLGVIGAVKVVSLVKAKTGSN